MRILVNASTLRSGGAIQKAVEFMSMADEFGDQDQWLFLVSPEVFREWDTEREHSHCECSVVPASPARIFRGRESRGILARAEDQFSPHVAFSIFGPAYYSFQCPHLLGFAVPWVTHPSPLAWSCLPLGERQRMRAWCEYVARWTQLASRWVTETGTSARGLARRLRVDPELVHTVPNCCSQAYFRAATQPGNRQARQESHHRHEFRLLTLSAWRPHKRLEMIPETAAELKRIDPGTHYTFVLTLDAESEHWRAIERRASLLDVSEHVTTVGPVPVREGPSLYQTADAMFLPSILETFSASYPEAMCMGTPIITTDLDFARDVCADGARYFRPNDTQSAAASIVEVRANGALRKTLCNVARDRLKSFGDRKERFLRYRELIEATATGHSRTHGIGRTTLGDLLQRAWVR